LQVCLCVQGKELSRESNIVISIESKYWTLLPPNFINGLDPDPSLHLTACQPVFQRFILMLFHLLNLPSGQFPRCFSIKVLYALHVSLIWITCSVHYNLLDLSTITVHNLYNANTFHCWILKLYVETVVWKWLLNVRCHDNKWWIMQNFYSVINTLNGNINSIKIYKMLIYQIPEMH